jgi:hypothetical protein
MAVYYNAHKITTLIRPARVTMDDIHQLDFHAYEEGKDMTYIFYANISKTGVLDDNAQRVIDTLY